MFHDKNIKNMMNYVNYETSDYEALGQNYKSINQNYEINQDCEVQGQDYGIVYTNDYILDTV